MEKLEKKKYWIWLSLIENFGSKKKEMLLKKYKTPEVIYNLTEKELLSIKGIGEKTVQNILDETIRNRIGIHIEFMMQNDIDIISIYDKEYPQILKEIYDPPISLYSKGNQTYLNNKSIGMVEIGRAHV